MAYDYTGVVEEVLPLQTFNKGFQKQVLVVGEDVDFEGKYPSHNPFEFKGEHVTDLNGVRKGMRVKVTFALEGRKWTDKAGVDKYFPTMSAFKISILQGEQKIEATAPKPPESAPEFGTGDDEELPF